MLLKVSIPSRECSLLRLFGGGNSAGGLATFHSLVGSAFYCGVRTSANSLWLTVSLPSRECSLFRHILALKNITRSPVALTSRE